MSGDPGDLTNLRDIALPDPISFWPPAAGTSIVAIAVAAFLAVLLWQAVQRYRALAYRREAIADLAAIGAEESGVTERVSAILKRVAMVDYGRTRVASLTGEAWADFIAETAPDTGAIRQSLMNVYVARRNPEPTEQRRLIEQAIRWVRIRRAPPEERA